MLDAQPALLTKGNRMPQADNQFTTNNQIAHIDASDTPESIKDRVLGDPLVKAIDALVEHPSRDTLREHDALLIGRCTEMAASAVLGTHLRIDEQGEEIALLRKKLDLLLGGGGNA